MYATTVLTEDELLALKKKSKEKSVKNALSIAVHHYLQCDYTDIGDEMQTRKLEKVIQKKKERDFY